MADTDPKLAATLITTVAAIFGLGAYLNRVPTSSRPQIDGSAPQHLESAQDVPARLWQDPLKLANEHFKNAGWALDKDDQLNQRPEARRKELIKWMRYKESDRATLQSKPKTSEDPKPIPETAEVKTANTLLLLAMIPGGSQPERTEFRLRLRQALVGALGTELYRPVQGMAIGYLRVAIPCLPPPRPGPNDSRLTVPFERFTRPHNLQGKGGAEELRNKCERIAVVWVPDDMAGTDPVEVLQSVTSWVEAADAAGKVHPWLEVAMLGPSSSDGLLQLWQSAKESSTSARALLGSVRFVSPLATLDDAFIHAARLPDNDRSVPKIERTNPDEYVVARALVAELFRRNVSLGPGHKRAGHVALISEWDTFHGRGIGQIYRRAFLNPFPKNEKIDLLKGAAAKSGFPISAAPGEWLESKQYKWLIQNRDESPQIELLHYLRGLDGRGPTSDRSAAASGAPNDGAKKSADEIVTEGDNQSDTVARLATRLEARHRQLIAQGEGGFRAIGVLGSDVYDKLMLLRALRPRFRGTVFFTNGLEARMSLDGEADACRNLVVGSAYGLELEEHLQSGVPPFRNHYQTALFAGALHLLGTVRLTGDRPFWDAQRPRLFEISLDRAIDLSIDAPTQRPLADSVHPPRSIHVSPLSYDRLQWKKVLACFVIGGLLLVGLVVQAWKNFLAAESNGSSSATKPKRLTHWLGRRIVGWPAMFLTALLIFISPWSADDSYREPFGFLNGASSWQSLAFFAGAIVCALHLLFRTSLILEENEWQLEQDYLLRPDEKEDSLRGEPHAAPRESAFVRFWRWSTMRWESCAKQSAQKGFRIDARRLWAEHQRLGDAFGMLRRALIPTALFFVALYFAFSFAPPPPLPWRSVDGNPIELLGPIILAGLVSALLLFLIAAEVLRACGLVRRLDLARMNWPKIVAASEQPFDQWQAEMLSEKADICFIEARTRAVGRITQYPFVLVLLLFIARNRYFDDWPTPLGVIIQFGSLLLITAALSWLLHLCAERARARSLRNLEEIREEIGKQPGATGSDRVETLGELDKTVAAVKNLRDGAYAPIWGQPVFRGLLVGSGGLGLTTLVPYFSRLF